MQKKTFLGGNALIAESAKTVQRQVCLQSKAQTKTTTTTTATPRTTNMCKLEKT
jgi:hypothetical protein